MQSPERRPTSFDPGRDDKPCSNRQCILGYAHDGPCICEGPLHAGVMALRAQEEPR